MVRVFTVSAVSRRAFLGCSMSAWAANAMIRAGSLPPRVAPYYKAVFDERFEDARRFAGAAAERSIPTAAIRGDVTSLFFHDLDLRWKQGPVRLIGLTTPASLFCLDLLARDRRMRLTTCLANPAAEAALRFLDEAPTHRKAVQQPSIAASGLVFWIIEPAAETVASGAVDA